MRKTIRLAAALVALTAGAVAALQGCSGSTNSGLGGGGGIVSVPVAADQFASAYGHAICDDMSRCCTGNGYGYDANGCLTAAQGIVQAEYINPAKVSSATYDANAAGECVARLRATVQACAQSADDKRLLNNACGRVYSGTKKPGEACKSSTECAGSAQGRASCVSWGTQSADGGGTSGSLCQIHKYPPAVGDTCNGLIESSPPPLAGDCIGTASELQCDTSSNTCQPRIAVGQKCTAFGSCAKEAYCNYTTKVCEAKVGDGQACTTGDECNATTYCDYQGTKTCLARKATGADCQSSDQCTSSSCKKGKCLANVVGSPEFCGAAPK